MCKIEIQMYDTKTVELVQRGEEYDNIIYVEIDQIPYVANILMNYFLDANRKEEIDG